MRIRWETAGKVIAGVAAALVIIGLAPSLLAPREPEPLPEDVGLTPVSPPPAPVAAAAEARERTRAARRRQAERRRDRLEARRLQARRRRRQRERRDRGEEEPVSRGGESGPVAIAPAFSPPPPPPPSAADEFGFER